MAQDRPAIKPPDVSEISKDRRSGRPPYEHGRNGERRSYQPADDDRQRLVLGKWDGSSTHHRYLFQSAGSLRPREWFAYADGGDSEDDTDACGTSAGASAGDENQRTVTRGRRCRHHGF